MDDAFIAAGLSGHGYRFCSVIGVALWPICLGKEKDWGVGGLTWDPRRGTLRVMFVVRRNAFVNLT